MQTGKLIVIDGGDGAGKKTQTKLLIDRLIAEGVEAVSFDFPQYERNTFGQLIRESLNGARGDFLSLDPRIASTIYAADRFESKALLESWLHKGKVVVCDRYVSSNMLHQGGKIADPHEREIFLKWLDSVEHEIFGVPRPDLIVYCAVDPQVRMQLLKTEAEQSATATDVVENDLAHQQQADVAAQHLIENLNNWQTIDCMDDEEMRSIESIHEDIYKLVSQYI